MNAPDSANREPVRPFWQEWLAVYAVFLVIEMIYLLLSRLWSDNDTLLPSARDFVKSAIVSFFGVLFVRAQDKRRPNAPAA